MVSLLRQPAWPIQVRRDRTIDAVQMLCILPSFCTHVQTISLSIVAAPVVQTFFVDEKIKEMYTLDSVITVVDAKNIITRLDDEKPEGVENEVS